MQFEQCVILDLPKEPEREVIVLRGHPRNIRSSAAESLNLFSEPRPQSFRERQRKEYSSPHGMTTVVVASSEGAVELIRKM
jgi:hypothetical protein